MRHAKPSNEAKSAVASERRRITFLALWVGCLALSAGAQEYTVHKVRERDSLRRLAARYYGDVKLYPLIQSYNQIASTILRIGQEIRIPIIRQHRIAAGETLDSIAQRYLGSAKRASILLPYNRLPATHTVSAGEILLIPPVLSYKVKRGDTLATVAKKALRNERAYAMIRRYNLLSSNALFAGQTLLIPLMFTPPRAMRTASPPAAASSTAVSPPGRSSAASTPRVSLLTGRLGEAVSAFEAGDFKRARSLLIRYLRTSPKPAEEQLARLYLGFVYAAFDTPAKARAEFSKAMAIGPIIVLPQADVAPRIQRLLEEARSAGK